jgi:hypothetical protein
MSFVPVESGVMDKQHDLDVMRRALAKVSEALPLIESADIGLRDVPAGIAVHEGANAPHLISEALASLERAGSVLKGAIDAR